MAEWSNKNPAVSSGISWSDNTLRIGDKQARTKAETIHGALGEFSPGVESLYSSLLADGNDTSFREQYSSQEMTDLEEARYAGISDILSGYSQEEISKRFEGLATFDPATAMTPLSINLEKGYAQNMADFVDSYRQVRAYDIDYGDFFNYRKNLEDKVLDQIAFYKGFEEINSYLEDLDEGLTSYDFVDFFQQGFPLRGAALQMNEIPSLENLSYLAGQNLKETVEFIRNIEDPAERLNQSRALITAIAEDGTLPSPDVAAKVADAILHGFDKESAFWDNIFIHGSDALFVPWIKGLRGAGKVAGSSAGRARAYIKGLSSRKPLVETAQELGDNIEIAKYEMVNTTLSDTIDDMTRNYPSLFNYPSMAEGKANIGSAAARQISDRLEANTFEALEKIRRVGSVDRVTLEQLDLAAKATETRVKRWAKGLEKHVVDIGESIRFNDLTNNYTYAMRFGYGGAPFPSKSAAIDFAENQIGFTKNFDYREIGEGRWFVETEFPIDETKGIISSVKDVEVTTKFASNGDRIDWLTDILDKPLLNNLSPRGVRSIVDKANMGARLSAVHGTEALVEAIEPLVRSLNKFTFSKQDRNEINRILHIQQATYNKKTKTEGVYFETVSEVEKAFFNEFGKYPKEGQIEAILSYKSISDIEFFMHELDIMKNLQRVGSIKLEVEALAGKKKEKVAVSGFARPVDLIPFSEDAPKRVAFIDEKGNVSFKTYSRSYTTESSKKFFDDFTNDGSAEIFEAVWNPIDIGDDVAHFVVSKKQAVKNRISPGNLGYNFGGHSLYEAGWGIKQPKLRGKETGVKYYTGDEVLLLAHTEKQARALTDAINKAKASLAKGTDEWKEIRKEKLYFWKEEEFEKVLRKSFSLDDTVPFSVVRSGQRSIDTYNYSTPQVRVIDSTEGVYSPLGEMDRAFSQTRQQSKLQTVIEESNGHMRLERARKLSPAVALETGLKNEIPKRIKRDYIYRSMNDLMRNLALRDKKVFNENLEKIINQPLDFLHFPDKYLVPGIDAKTRKEIDVYRKNILSILENTSPEYNMLEAFRMRLLDYAAPGSTKFEFIKDYMIPLIKDPFVFSRRMVFASNQGFWNWTAFLPQMQQFTIMAGAYPEFALQSFAGAIFQKMAMFTEQVPVLNHLAKHYAMSLEGQLPKNAIGTVAKDFLEMTQLGKDKGAFRVGNSYALIDDITDVDFTFGSRTKRTANAVINSASMFVRHAEELMKMTAWNIAYLEFKKKNPTKTLTQADKDAILNRADVLSGAMSAANNQYWAKGALSVPMQYQTFWLRTMGTVTPSLIGAKDYDVRRAWQVLVAQGIAYGALDGSLSTALPLAPYSDLLKEEMIKNNYDWSEDWYANVVMEGLPDFLVQTYMGIDPDFSRFSLKNDVIYNILSGDEKMFEVLFGPSYDLWKGVVATPVKILGSFINQRDEFELTQQDWIDLAGSIGTLRHINEVDILMTHNKWVTRTSNNQADLNDKREALFFAIARVKPDAINEGYLIKNVERKRKEKVTEAKKEAKRLLERAIRVQDTNPDETDALIRRANTLLATQDIVGRSKYMFLREIWKDETDIEKATELMKTIARKAEQKSYREGQE